MAPGIIIAVYKRIKRKYEYFLNLKLFFVFLMKFIFLAYIFLIISFPR